jgi:predicted DNA-binding protein
MVVMADKHVRVDDEQYQALQELSKANGIPIAEQVRRAIREWLEKRQAQVKDE